MNPTAELARFVAEHPYDAVPVQIRERSLYLALDGIGCALAGAGSAWVDIALRGLASIDRGDGATVWGRGIRMTPVSAAVLNATATQATEMDDYHVMGPLHVESVVLTSTIATAESLGLDDGRLLAEAVLFGQEAGPRTGMALGGMVPILKGWHNGAVNGTVAAGAACARLRGLDAERTNHALGIAGTQAGGLMAAQFDAMITHMHHGFSARAGLTGAALASVGYTGVDDVIARDYGGMMVNFSDPDRCDLAALTADLGERWEIERIALKPYANMAGVHLPIELTLEHLAETGTKADDLAEVVVECAGWLVRKGGERLVRPLPLVAAQMSIAYGVAVATLHGDAGPREFARDLLDDDRVHDLAGRVRVVLADDLDALPHEDTFAARLTFVDADGGRTVRERVDPPGGHRRPMSNAEIVAKFRRITDGVITSERAAAIEETVLDLPHRSVSALVDLLGPEVGGFS